MGIKTIDFCNSGAIDPRVWSTFGVSVKEGDNAIGQFGTGLKYAIAVLMREGRSLSIKSEGELYVFGVENADIRGKEFEQITCNGAPLPFTTHLGAGWELWQAYREIHSNCLDEGGSIGGGGDTVITAQLGDIRHRDVFLEPDQSTKIAEAEGCDVYPGTSHHVYYRGIRALELNTPSRHTYDIQHAALTEDRTFKHFYQIEQEISQAVLGSNDRDFVFDFMTQTKGWFEENLDLDWASSYPSEMVVEVASELRRESVYKHPTMFKKAIEKLGKAPFELKTLDARQAQVIKEASEFCSEIGYPVTFPVMLATNLGSDTLAVADRTKGQIYLSDRVLTQGIKQVASTLIEENLHLQEGLSDCTYQMQSYLFDQIVTMGERLTGRVL